VRPSKTPEVALASEARPLSEYGQGQNLRITEQGGPTDFRWLQRALKLPPIVYLDVHYETKKESRSTSCGTILWREFGASAYDLGSFSVDLSYI
jgi:hypothetical protein